MNWFFISLIFLWVLIGICPRLIANTVQKAVETNYWERDRMVNRLNNIILFFSWVIIFTSVAEAYFFVRDDREKIEALEKRIEALETPPQMDTVNIVDIIKNE